MYGTRALLAAVSAAVILLAACSSSAEEATDACSRTEADAAASDATVSLASLHQRIDELGGGLAEPVVPMNLFLEANDDEASVAPNLYPHPGLDTFRCVFREIAARPEVAHVLFQISEVISPEEWPYANPVYVVTTAPTEEVHEWAAELQPDPYDETVPDDWLGGEPPPGAPPIPDGHRVVVLFWD